MSHQAPFTDYASVQDYLFSLKARGVKFGIDRMRLLVAALGHPELALPTIHITGTNGKGSTAAMLESIFRGAGWKVGLYTSPHLVRLGERVQVNRRILSEAEIIAFVNELNPVAGDLGRASPDDHPSFFEFMTAMAFLQFVRKGCNLSVVEVGLGGRLDATNVLEPEVSVITSISLDHCEMLGETVERISAEKAGIIKPGRPVVMGRIPPAAEEVVRTVAGRLGCPVHSVRAEFGDDLDRYPRTNLEGDYQRWNAATATLTARLLGPAWKLTSRSIEEGLQHVVWPGRWQRLTLAGRSMILDASHNPEGADVLRDNLESLRRVDGRKPVFITGALGVARAGPLLSTIADYAREIHLVVPHQARATPFEELERLVPPTFRGIVKRASLDALFPGGKYCAAGEPGDLVIVTGSIYLLGEVFALIAPEMGSGEGRLQDF